MNCPNCGLYLDRPTERCPRCGQPLSRGGAPSGPNPYGAQGGYGPPPQQGPMQPPQPPYGYPDPSAGYPGYGGGGQSSGQGYGYPAQPSRPMYGSGAPSGPYGDGGQGYGQGYGQPARPSTPVMPSPWGNSAVALDVHNKRTRKRSFIGLGIMLVIIVAVVVVYSLHPSGVLYEDPLTSNSASSHGWPDTAGSCFFAGDGYHVVDAHACYPQTSDFTDANFMVTVKQISGPKDYFYGITFRHFREGTAYQFGIDGNGEWTFEKANSGQLSEITAAQKSDAIHAGQPNNLRVLAKGAHFWFYINGTFVGQAEDNSITFGGAGVAAEQNVEAVFTNFKVTKPDVTS